MLTFSFTIIIFWAKTENFSQVYICLYIPITYHSLCVNCELCERDGASIISLCLVKSLSHFHVLSSFPFSNNDEQLRLTNKGSTISHNHPYCYRSPTKIYIYIACQLRIHCHHFSPSSKQINLPGIKIPEMSQMITI